MIRGPLVFAFALVLLAGLALNALAADTPVREFEKSVALRSGGSVKIENVIGPVTVSGWDREEVRVIAVISLNSELTGKQARKKLDAVEIEVDHSWNGVVIRTKFPDDDLLPDGDGDLDINLVPGINFGDGNGGLIEGIVGLVGEIVDGISGWATRIVQRKIPLTVSYNVKVPARCQLKIRTVTGDILITDVAGEVEAGLVTGRIALADVAGKLDCGLVTGKIEIEGAGGFVGASVISGAVSIGFAQDSRFEGIDCNVVNGSVLVRIPDIKAMDFDIKTVNGKISMDLDSMSAEMVHGTSYVGSMGGGGPKIDIKAINGSIRLERAVQ